MNKSIYYTAVWVWLLSLGKMHLRFTRATAPTAAHSVSFLLCGGARLFIQQLAEEQLSRSQLLVIAGKAAINIHTVVFV